MQSRSLLALVTSSTLATLPHNKTRHMCVCQADLALRCVLGNRRDGSPRCQGLVLQGTTWHREMTSQDNQTVGSSQPGHGLWQFEDRLVLIEPGRGQYKE